MQNYKALRVVTRAREVIKATYAFTRELPREEQFGLTSQMRRAAISVGLNIAEGCSRRTTKEFIRFLEIAVGSAMELDFALVVCEDLTYGSPQSRTALCGIVNLMQRELVALMRALRKRMADGTRK
jgi:four helix bundle protein